MVTDTTVTDNFRDVTISNLDSLGERYRTLEAELSRIESEHRQSLEDQIKALRDANRASLVNALAPLEAALQDTRSAIYAAERMLGALPPAAARFQERSDIDAGEESAPAQVDEGSGGGVAEREPAVA